MVVERIAKFGFLTMNENSVSDGRDEIMKHVANKKPHQKNKRPQNSWRESDSWSAEEPANRSNAQVAWFLVTAPISRR